MTPTTFLTGRDCLLASAYCLLFILPSNLRRRHAVRRVASVVSARRSAAAQRRREAPSRASDSRGLPVIRPFARARRVGVARARRLLLGGLLLGSLLTRSLLARRLLTWRLLPRRLGARSLL